MFNTPILFIIFNRLSTTKQVFAKIAEVQPKQLFIAADGPCADKPGEAQICKEVKDWVLSQINWDCDVQTLFREENLGCGRNISDAITWFFNNVEQGIILEDDCVPVNSFFTFCELMLNKYKDDNSIKLISGSNYLYNEMKLDAYFLASFYYIWGWATWKRAWQEIDYTESTFPCYPKLKTKIKSLYKDEKYSNWILSMIEDTYKFRIDTWDLKLVYTFLMNDGKGIIPYKNLISNIGLQSSRTNNTSKSKSNKYSSIEMPTCEIDFTNFKMEPDLNLASKGINLNISNVVRILKGHTNLIKRLFRFCLYLAYKIFYCFKQLFIFNDPQDLCTNVFSKNNSKTVLLSYITEPFKEEKLFKGHSNHLECLTAAKIFDSLGFNVDAINLFSPKKINYNKYDVIYGQGPVLERSFQTNKKILRFYYCTGCSIPFSNIETLKKARLFYSKTSMYGHSSTRFCEKPEDKQLILSDKLIVLGNEFTQKTFTDFDSGLLTNNRCSRLSAFYFKSSLFNKIDTTSFKSKKHFLWFGSSGCLHKGLDTALNIFIERSDIILHICGGSQSEKEFWSYYNPIIQDKPNIINHGFINIDSYEFKKIMEICLFSIYPTVSEGGSPSLINTMANGGLIPITTVNAGLDLPTECILAKANTEEDFRTVINEYLSFTNEDLIEISSKVRKYTLENYTYTKYQENLSKIISDTVNLYYKEV